MMLTRIIDAAEIRAVEAQARIEEFTAKVADGEAARGFGEALLSPGLSVIAEIKRRSPSAGDINVDLDPAIQAAAYEAGGADAISVLTEPDFFGGSLDDLVAVRGAVSIPVLRKDFTRNEAQLAEARAAGADAALLIVATLEQGLLERLVAEAQGLGIDVIVEAHTLEEVERAVASGAAIIGVNNRDLDTFTVDLSVAEALAPEIPDTLVSIAESGLSSAAGASRMRSAHYDAILVGEALVRSPDPAMLVSVLKGAS